MTFVAPPPSEDEEIPSEESSLFPEPSPTSSFISESGAPPASSNNSKRRKKSSKSSTDDSQAPSPSPDDPADLATPAHIPRPPNAFILFRSSFIRSQHVSASIEGNHGTLSKIVGMVWHNLPFREREVWQAKARKALAEHKRKYPGYSFRPTKDKKGAGGAGDGRGGGGGVAGDDDGTANLKSNRDESVPPPVPQKRKQREVGPRDVARCEQIAALLSKGLKGKALEDAIAQFDAQRAPVVITPRFEAPITASQFEVKKEGGEEMTAPKKEEERPSVRKYRRSSSAPLLDVADHAKHAQFMRSASPIPSAPSNAFSSFSATNSSPPRPQSSTASPPTPTQTNSSATPTAQSFGFDMSTQHRKRSTSSSPPLRSRTLPSYTHPQPYGHSLMSQQSMPSFSNPFVQQAPQLTLATALSTSYHASQPLSAPVLARQATSSSLYGCANDAGLDGNNGSDVFFDYDSTNPMQWYAAEQESWAQPQSQSSMVRVSSVSLLIFGI